MTEVAESRIAALVSAAASTGLVVPAFNAPYLPMVAAICQSLSELDAFGLIEVARLEILKFEARGVAEVAAEHRRIANLRVCGLHLDHIPAVDEDGHGVDWGPWIEEGIRSGYDSIMIDGSRLPFDENVEVTRAVVGMAHEEGIAVEGELGSVLGHEPGPLPPYEEVLARKIGFTDPGMAREFVVRTGVDWLSVAVGSIHGAIAGAARNRAKPRARLDIDHLKRIRGAAGVPLVLHGGSGIEQAYIDRAVSNGVAKINIGMDIRQPYERALAAGGTVEQAQSAVRDAVSRIVSHVFHIEGSASRLHQLTGHEI
jgi:fructose/tagatose bisphosphate aldolase